MYRPPKPSDEDDERRLDRMMEDDTGRLESNAGITFLPMPVPQGRDLPATNPVRWREFEERFHFRPYDSPEEEYRLNIFPLNLQTLLYRWSGLGMEARIYKMFSSDTARLDRIHAQAIRRREMALPDPKDPADIKANNAYQVQIAKDRIDFIKAQLDNNCEMTVDQYFRFNEGGTVIKEELRTLSATSRAKLDKDLREWIETYRMLTDQSGGTSTLVHEAGQSIRDVLLEREARLNQPVYEGLTVTQLNQIDRGALPPPSEAVLEGEVVPAKNNNAPSK